MAQHGANVAVNGYELNINWATEIDPQPIHWLWPQKLARGKIAIIAGDPGQGKSTLAMDLAARVSKGGVWPDGADCEKGVALILNAEDASDDTIVPRLMAADADRANVGLISGVAKATLPGAPPEEVLFNFAQHVMQLGQTLDTMKQQGKPCQLLIVDPLSAYLADKDSYKAAEMRSLLQPLSKLAERYDCAVVCIHHLKKDRSGGALNALSGSIAFGALARTVWWVGEDAEDETRERHLMLSTKSNITKKNASGSAFTIETSWLVHDGQQIETSHIKWLDEDVIKSADEAVVDLDDKRSKKQTRGAAGRQKKCDEYLRTALAGGARDGEEIMDEARASGFTNMQLYAARDRMKLDKGNGVWALLDEFETARAGA